MLSFFLESIRPFKLLVFAQFIVGVFLALDLSLRPYLIKVILDKIEAHNVKTVTLFAIFFIIASIVNLLMIRLSMIIWLYLNSNLKKHLSLVIMDKLFLHSHNFYLNNFAGSLASQIKEVMSGIPDLCKILFEKIISNALALIFAIYTFMKIDNTFALILILWAVLYIILSVKLSNFGNRFYNLSAQIRSKTIGHMVDLITNMLIIRLFNSKRHEKKKLESILNEYVAADRARDCFAVKLLTLQGCSFIIYQTICLFILIKSIWKISIGDFVLIFSINISIVNCLWSLSREIGTFTELYNNLKQALDKFLISPEIEDKQDASELIITKGEIIFDKVSFAYSDNHNILTDLSLVIKSKQKVGLVGLSAAGKTTFVNLIMRLFELNSGRILIDQQDISLVTQESLREAISFIPQESLLFHRSLKDNINYANKFSDQEIMIAAKNAYANEFIEKLGYDSIVGERGIKLSGGQRQRITIARFFLKNSPILIIDEATSQLDSITEQQIKKSLDKLMSGKTNIIIAHRLSTLLRMDRILVLDSHGNIREDGTHQELLKQHGLYHKLWQLQQQDFIEDKLDLVNQHN
jgi:ATP-binding cassette subfamily B protein